MSEVIKAGKFSSKYTYILTSNGQYALINSSRIHYPQELIGKSVRRDTSSSCLDSQLASGLSFRLTAARLLYFSIFLMGGSVLLWMRVPSLVIMIWSLVLHEFGHIGIAFVQGAHDIVLGARLQYGFAPILYVSNRTIYEHSRVQRILYYSGGIMVNLALTAVGFTLLHLISGGTAPHQHLALIVRFNIFLVLINLYPLMFTDGFNILREILQLYDLRRLVVSHLAHPRTLLAINRVAFFYYIFVVLSLAVAIGRVALTFFEFL